MKKTVLILIAVIIIVALTSAAILFIRNPSDLCKQEVKGKGACEAYFVGYKFDNSIGKCVEIGVSGCSFEAPFKTLGKCQSVCEK